MPVSPVRNYRIPHVSNGVKLARKTGFCFGVKRAVAMAEAALKKSAPIYSLGSVIHNKQVVRELSRRGLKVVKDTNGIKGGMLVISSHGISPKTACAIRARSIKIIDTTCPFVVNAQKAARRLSDEGYKVVIVGDAGHPEIKALVNFVPKRAFVVKDSSEAQALKLGPGDMVSVISQTTQSTGNFFNCIEAILGKHPKELKVVNTICADAGNRQDEARRLAAKVDCMLVIGGKDSANTNRLFEVTKKVLNRSHLVESEKDLKNRWFKKGEVIGITSGASTPDWVIKKVINKINSKSN